MADPTTESSRECPIATGERLALRAKEAAKALGISPRLLWSLTNQNLIPHCRLGKAIAYPVAGLQEWLQQQSEGR